MGIRSTPIILGIASLDIGITFMHREDMRKESIDLREDMAEGRIPIHSERVSIHGGTSDC